MSADHLRTVPVRPETSRDPRTRLAREKFFSMRPKPLERWIWKQGIPASAERVFWYHWDLGNRNGTWLSQVPIRIVGRDCCLDPATVTRAYQLLRRLDLIRRQDPGRDPANPFQQATAVTEVRIPQALLASLAREPSRPTGRVADLGSSPSPTLAAVPDSASSGRTQTTPNRESLRAVFARLSGGERSRFAEASRHRRTTVEFDADSRLGPEERGHVLATLVSLARARPAAVNAAPRTTAAAEQHTGPRRVPALDLIRLQKSLRTLATASGTATPANLLREVVYAAEEGALSRFAPPFAINVALKKIREGAWSTPRRMPADWGRHRAFPESCSTAGQG